MVFSQLLWKRLATTTDFLYGGRGWTSSPGESTKASELPDNIALLLLATETIRKQPCQKVMGTLCHEKGRR